LFALALALTGCSGNSGKETGNVVPAPRETKDLKPVSAPEAQDPANKDEMMRKMKGQQSAIGQKRKP